MFAGRYVWWLLTGSGLLLIALFGFDGAAWLTLVISDCTRAESCYTLNTFLMAGLKPALAFFAGLALVGCILMRVLWLRLSPLWIVPVLVWALAIAATLKDYGPLWHGNWDVMELLRNMPPVALAFAVLALFLCFPLEDEDVPERGQAAPLGIMAGFAALVCTLHVAATAASLPVFLSHTLRLNDTAVLIDRIQTLMTTFLLVHGGNNVPGLVMVMLFAIALSLRIVRHERLVAG